MPTHPPRGEREFLRRIGPLLAGAPVDSASRAVPFGDDMAALPGAGPLLWTVDMLMDGVDFDSRADAWALIGRKAMAVNLSDCAAMAAEPVGALAAVSLSNQLAMEDAVELLRGAQELGLRYHCPIFGGDTNSWDAPTVIAITVAARCPGHEPLRRDGARPGDRIWLSGPVGGSILGRHLRFEPRISLALEAARRLRPRAAIDISDGLALDLTRILEASGCGAVLPAAALDAAIHPDAHALAARDGRPAREHALGDGEDFELILVLPPDAPDDECRRLGLLPLGAMIPGTDLLLEDADGARTVLPPQGWEHFR